jgi:hypothetical protein
MGTHHFAIYSVMRGLDPRIHDESPRVPTLRQSLRHSLVDGRVKPGHDGGETLRTTTYGAAA